MSAKTSKSLPSGISSLWFLSSFLSFSASLLSQQSGPPLTLLLPFRHVLLFMFRNYSVTNYSRKSTVEMAQTHRAQTSKRSVRERPDNSRKLLETRYMAGSGGGKTINYIANILCVFPRAIVLLRSWGSSRGFLDRRRKKGRSVDQGNIIHFRFEMHASG